MKDEQSPEDKELESILKQANLQTDDRLHVNEPSLRYFEGLVQEQNDTWHRRLLVELACLWGIAFIFISFLGLTLFYVPLLFILIQMITTLILIGYFLRERKEMEVMRQ
ncbi:hypothetical protein SAMN04487936_109120 [Halobacillus dabanensis]|uniref:Uncharacterized protein n=1 Tax=Halobacillus dabanensis TaxID=240302 RepID=A0A1I3XUQ2_HALDA|nr:YxlC family protein [Halobacillus dabanensis]SFK22736.1 hypothetical protein SAMN04487936_109120 [Halobacillus dabanensis]